MNKKLNHLILGLIFMICGQSLLAQEKVNFNIQPNKATIRIDGKSINRGFDEAFTLELETGTHTIEIWAPEFELFIDEFTVNPDKENTYSKGLLTQSEGFKEYKAKLKKYNSAKFTNILSTIGAVAGNAAMYYVIWDGGKVKDLNEMEARLEIAQNSFVEAVHPDDIQMIRANFDQTKASHNELVKSLNTRRAIGIPIGVGVSALSYMLLKKKKKPEKPTYNPENPLVLNNINLNMNQGLALQLNFNF